MPFPAGLRATSRIRTLAEDNSNSRLRGIDGRGMRLTFGINRVFLAMTSSFRPVALRFWSR